MNNLLFQIFYIYMNDPFSWFESIHIDLKSLCFGKFIYRGIVFSVFKENVKWAAVRQNQQNDLCAQRRIRSVWASHAQRRLIRLGGCPGWSEYSLVFLGFVLLRLKWTFQGVSQSQKGKQKSPGRATSRSRSQPPTLGGREKVTQNNVWIANEQMHDKHKYQFPLPQARWSKC